MRLLRCRGKAPNPLLEAAGRRVSELVLEGAHFGTLPMSEPSPALHLLVELVQTIAICRRQTREDPFPLADHGIRFVRSSRTSNGGLTSYSLQECMEHGAAHHHLTSPFLRREITGVDH